MCCSSASGIVASTILPKYTLLGLNWYPPPTLDEEFRTKCTLLQKSVWANIWTYSQYLIWVRSFSRLVQISTIEFKVSPNNPMWSPNGQLGSKNGPSSQLIAGPQMVPKVVIFYDSISCFGHFVWFLAHHHRIISASSVHHQSITSTSSAHHQRIIRASSERHQSIISASAAHHQSIISASSTHYQRIISASSAHH